MGVEQGAYVLKGPYLVEVFVPLYGFASDREFLQLSASSEVVKYRPSLLQHLFEEQKDLKADWLIEGSDTLRDYLTTFPPDYLIRTRDVIEGGSFNWVLCPHRDAPEVSLPFPMPQGNVMIDPLEWLVAFRLFKPGLLRAGDACVHCQCVVEGVPKPGFLILYNFCNFFYLPGAGSHVDSLHPVSLRERYQFESEELGSFLQFAGRVRRAHVGPEEITEAEYRKASSAPPPI